MSTLFISHSASDHEIAEALRSAINELLGESMGLIEIQSSSSAERGPQGGDKWRQWIDRQVVEAKTALIVLSRESVTRSWPLWEAAACRGVALQRMQKETEPVDPLIIALRYGITNDECPDPLREEQICSGENPDEMIIVFKKILKYHQADENVFVNVGEIGKKVLCTYIDSVKKTLLNAPSLVTEATVQDWLVRLDKLEEDKRSTELTSYQSWMNIAFGHDPTSPTTMQRQIDLRLHRRLGDYYLEQRNFVLAIEQLRLARESAPRDIYVLSRLTEALIKQILKKSDKHESVKELQPEIEELQQRITVLDPDAIYTSPDTAASVAKYSRRIKERPEEAITIYTNALKHNPDSYYLSDVLAQTQLEVGKIREATKTYEITLAILKRIPDRSVWSFATKITANLVLNNLNDAKKAIGEILKLHPTKNQLMSIKEGILDICAKTGIAEKDKKDLMTRMSQ